MGTSKRKRFKLLTSARAAQSYLNNLRTAYRKNLKGTIAIWAAAFMLPIIVATGAAVNIASLHNAQTKTQNLADALALNAARELQLNLGSPPSGKWSFEEGRVYSASDLGLNLKGLSETYLSGVEVVFDIDEINSNVEVQINGKISPIFSEIIGKDALAFSAHTTTSFLEQEFVSPTSLIFVTDASSSMRGRYAPGPSNSLAPVEDRRSYALQMSLIEIVKQLAYRFDGSTKSGHKKLRTGIVPFSDVVIENRLLHMSWTLPSVTQIENIRGSGTTDITVGLRRALEWLEIEDTYHKAEASSANQSFQESEKFVVLLSDGENTAGNWIRIEPYDDPCGCDDPYYLIVDGVLLQSYEPKPGYIQGTPITGSNAVTSELCTELKYQGVNVLTIGFALGRNQYGRLLPEPPTEIRELLESCASHEDYFFEAENDVELTEIFNEILQRIVLEELRIKT